MSGVVRSVMIRMAVNNAQAIAGTRQLGDEVERTAKRASRGATDWRKANDVVGRGARNAFLLGAGGLALMERSIVSFDKEMSRAGAAADVGQAALGQLREAAIQAGQDTAFSATEAAQGITELAKAGVSTSDILHGGLKGSLDLAAAGQIGVAEAAETASSAMTQFALKGGDVTHIADLLAAGASKAQGGVHDLGMALNQSGLVASQVGLSIEDTVGTLTAFAKAGLIGSDAGTSFKTMLLSLNPRSEQAGKLMKRFNIEAYDAQGQFIGITKYAGKLRDGLKGLSDEQRARVLSKVFGTDAIRAANILYRNGADGISKWIKKVDDSGFAQDQAGKNLDNLAGDFEKFKGSLETAFIKGGSGAQKGLRSMVQDAEKLVNKFNELPASVQGGVVKAIAIGTAIAGATFLVSKLIKGFNTLRDITGVSKVAQAAGGIDAVGVQKVYVVNLPPGGGLAGAAGGAAGEAPIVAGATKATVLSKVARGGIVLVGAAIAAGINQQIQEALRGLETQGNEKGLFGDFKKPKELASEKFLLPPSHTLKRDLNSVASAQKFGGVFGDLDRAGAGLVGGDSLTKATASVQKLDSAISKLAGKDSGKALDAYNEAAKKSGMSTEELAKVLPKANQALFGTKKAAGDVGDVLLGAVSPAMAAAARATNRNGLSLRQYARGLASLPKSVRTKVTTPGTITSMADVRRLARQYNLTPRQIRTLIRLTGAGPAKNAVNQFIRILGGVNGKEAKAKASLRDNAKRPLTTLDGLLGKVGRQNVKPTASLRDHATGPINSVRSNLSHLNGQSATTYIYTVHKTKKAEGGLAGEGSRVYGQVVGAGGARDDLVNARLSAREYVMPVDAVDYYGVGVMEGLRSRSIPRFAGGGDVARVATPWAVQRGGSQAGSSSVGNDLARAVADALRGISVTGTLSTPFGPQELRGVINGVGGERDDMAGMRIRAGATR